MAHAITMQLDAIDVATMNLDSTTLTTDQQTALSQIMQAAGAIRSNLAETEVAIVAPEPEEEAKHDRRFTSEWGVVRRKDIEAVGFDASDWDDEVIQEITDGMFDGMLQNYHEGLRKVCQQTVDDNSED